MKERRSTWGTPAPMMAPLWIMGPSLPTKRPGGRKEQRYFGICSTLVLLQQHVKDPGHSAKSAGGSLQLNTHAPYVCGSERSDTVNWCMVHGCMVYTERVPRRQQFHVHHTTMHQFNNNNNNNNNQTNNPPPHPPPKKAVLRSRAGSMRFDRM